MKKAKKKKKKVQENTKKRRKKLSFSAFLRFLTSAFKADFGLLVINANEISLG